MIAHSESLAGLAAALAAAQGEMENATKNANNPHFRSSYADLAEVLNTVRPVLAKHGLSVVQLPGFAEGVVTVDTMLMHSSGEWIRSTAGAPAQKQDPQGVGSAVTYLRRYSLAAVCGIALEDDDGQAAGQSRAAAGRQQGGTAKKASGSPSDKHATALAYLKAAGDSGVVTEEHKVSIQGKGERPLREWLRENRDGIREQERVAVFAASAVEKATGFAPDQEGA